MTVILIIISLLSASLSCYSIWWIVRTPLTYAQIIYYNVICNDYSKSIISNVQNILDNNGILQKYNIHKDSTYLAEDIISSFMPEDLDITNLKDKLITSQMSIIVSEHMLNFLNTISSDKQFDQQIYDTEKQKKFLPDQIKKTQELIDEFYKPLSKQNGNYNIQTKNNISIYQNTQQEIIRCVLAHYPMLQQIVKETVNTSIKFFQKSFLIAVEYSETLLSDREYLLNLLYNKDLSIEELKQQYNLLNDRNMLDCGNGDYNIIKQILSAEQEGNKELIQQLQVSSSTSRLLTTVLLHIRSLIKKYKNNEDKSEKTFKNIFHSQYNLSNQLTQDNRSNDNILNTYINTWGNDQLWGDASQMTEVQKIIQEAICYKYMKHWQFRPCTIKNNLLTPYTKLNIFTHIDTASIITDPYAIILKISMKQDLVVFFICFIIGMVLSQVHGIFAKYYHSDIVNKLLMHEISTIQPKYVTSNMQDITLHIQNILKGFKQLTAFILTTLPKIIFTLMIMILLICVNKYYIPYVVIWLFLCLFTIRIFIPKINQAVQDYMEHDFICRRTKSETLNRYKIYYLYNTEQYVRNLIEQTRINRTNKLNQVNKLKTRFSLIINLVINFLIFLILLNYCTFLLCKKYLIRNICHVAILIACQLFLTIFMNITISKSTKIVDSINPSINSVYFRSRSSQTPKWQAEIK